MNDSASAFHPIFAGIEIGIGIWAWGDRLFWGYRQDYNDQDIQAAFKTSLDSGMVFFDTAEVYGQGQSEKILGELQRDLPENSLKIATKFMPYPWRLTSRALSNALKGSLRRLNRKKVELYQVHQPFPPVRVETWMEAMVEAVHAGQTEAVGVSNYDLAKMMRAYEALQREGVPLASNQMEYSLLDRRIEKNGLLARCKELNIRLIAYSPLAQGVLTGKYTPENPPRGFRSRKYDRKLLEQVKPLIVVLKKIGADHGGKNAAQVAINWCICKGTLPIPGAKNLQQAEQNCGSAGWRLSEDEIFLLDETSERVVKTD